MLFSILLIACSENDTPKEVQLNSDPVVGKDRLLGNPILSENHLPFEKVLIPLDDNDFTGDYLVEQVTPGIFGFDTFDPDGDGVVLTLLNNEMAADTTEEEIVLSDMQRAFNAVYLAELGFEIPTTFVMEFFSEKVYFPNLEFTGLVCGDSPITLGFPLSVPGRFDIANDTIFSLRFLDDVDNSCTGQQVDVELLFKKL